MTEQRRLTICAELARRMYPDGVIEPSFVGDGVDIRVYDKPNETRTWYNFDPFTNAEDKDALVAWLAADDDRWLPFKKELRLEWVASTSPRAASLDYERWMLTLPCEVIVIAAARALGIPEASE